MLSIYASMYVPLQLQMMVADVTVLEKILGKPELLVPSRYTIEMLE